MNNVPRAMFSWSNAATISIRHRQAPLANGHQAYMRPYSLCMTDSLGNLPLASGHQPDAASGYTVTLNGPLASAHLPLVGCFLEIKCSKYHASLGQAHNRSSVYLIERTMLTFQIPRIVFVRINYIVCVPNLPFLTSSLSIRVHRMLFCLCIDIAAQFLACN